MYRALVYCPEYCSVTRVLSIFNCSLIVQFQSLVLISKCIFLFYLFRDGIVIFCITRIDLWQFPVMVVE